MSISLGFIVVVIFILIPGILYRRLYFYGEFSKEFRCGHNTIGLLALSSLPGLLLFISSLWIYQYIFSPINVSGFLKEYKIYITWLTSRPQHHLSTEDFFDLIRTSLLPFTGFMYLTSLLAGLAMGRAVRLFRLDSRFKLLRFKNYWFYLLNGKLESKKLKFLKKKGERYVFTKADVLIPENGETMLYSGMVVDYQLAEGSCSILNKLVLSNAARWVKKEDVKVRKDIPGELFILDCSEAININLYYLYKKQISWLNTKIPERVTLILFLIQMSSIPLFIFNIQWLEDVDPYKSYQDFNVVSKLLVFMSLSQLLSVFNPFIRVKQKYQYTNLAVIIGKLLLIGIYILLIYLLN